MYNVAIQRRTRLSRNVNILQAGQSTFIGFPCEVTVINTAYSKVLCALSVLIAWLNLDIGIEICFYSSMDMFAKAWLQFLFPVYVWILVAIMIISSHYSIRASKIFGTNSPKVLVTLLLLMYTKILDAVLTLSWIILMEGVLSGCMMPTLSMQLPPQNIRHRGVAPTIAYSYDSDMASPLY